MPTALLLTLSLLAVPSATQQETAGLRSLRPAELVAEQARSVLYGRGDPAALEGLAGALPELAVSGGADIESTFQAARIAERLSGAPNISPTPEPESSLVMDVLRGIDPEVLGTVLALIAISLAFWLAVGQGGLRLFEGAKYLTLLKSHIDQLLERPANTRGRVQRARELAHSGVPLGEVARQTGISRDALSALLRINT